MAVARTRALDEQARFQVPTKTLVSSNPVSTINRPNSTPPVHTIVLRYLRTVLWYYVAFLGPCSISFSLCIFFFSFRGLAPHSSSKPQTCGSLRLFPQSPVSSFSLPPPASSLPPPSCNRTQSALADHAPIRPGDTLSPCVAEKLFGCPSTPMEWILSSSAKFSSPVPCEQ